MSLLRGTRVGGQATGALRWTRGRTGAHEGSGAPGHPGAQPARARPRRSAREVRSKGCPDRDRSRAPRDERACAIGAAMVGERAAPSRGGARPNGIARRGTGDSLARGDSVFPAAKEPRPGGTALRFSIHAGWAAVVAVALGPGADAPGLVGRRRVVMIPGTDSDGPPFVYDALRDLELELAGQAMRDGGMRRSTARGPPSVRPWRTGRARAARSSRAAPSGRVERHRPPSKRSQDPRACPRRGGRVLSRGHPAGERGAGPQGERGSRPRPAPASLAAILGIPLSGVSARLGRTGRAAGSPWGKDQKEAFRRLGSLAG